MQNDLTVAKKVASKPDPTTDAGDSVTLNRRIMDLEGQVTNLEARLTKQTEELEKRRQQASAAQLDLLRVRDLLVTSDRALGQLKGERTSLQDELFSYQGLLDRHHDVINSTIWQMSWKFLTPYRKLRTRLETRR